MDLLRRAMGTATLPKPKEPDGARLRQEVVQAYRDHVADPVPPDSLDRPAAARVVLGRYVYLAQLLTGRLQHVRPAHLQVVEQALGVLSGEAHPDVDDVVQRTILGRAKGKPYQHAWDSVTAVFTAAHGGFSYDVPVIFGSVDAFFRFAVGALAQLWSRGGSVEPRDDERSDALNSCDVAEVDKKVRQLEAQQGTVIRLSDAAQEREDAVLARSTGRTVEDVRAGREAGRRRHEEFMRRFEETQVELKEFAARAKAAGRRL